MKSGIPVCLYINEYVNRSEYFQAFSKCLQIFYAGTDWFKSHLTQVVQWPKSYSLSWTCYHLQYIKCTLKMFGILSDLNLCTEMQNLKTALLRHQLCE